MIDSKECIYKTTKDAMKLELIQFQSTDKLLLPGLFYQPLNHQTTRAAVWLHGMGDTGVFYNPPRINALGKTLTSRNISLLAFNNRGAYNKKTLKINDESLTEENRIYQAGTHYELIADSTKDINGAVNFLRTRGYSTLYLIGHSTGANKVCVYHTREVQTEFTKYVLAGPGDDVGLFYDKLGDKKFHLALKYAKQCITQNHPWKIMPKYTGMYPFSAQSANEILDANGTYNTFPFLEATTTRLGKKTLFAELRKIDIPTLCIFGELDEYAYTAGGTKTALKLMEQAMIGSRQTTKGKHSFQIVQGADHGFKGYEQQFATQVTAWLEQDS